MRKIIRQCVDRTPSLDQLALHASHAVLERPSNVAMGLDLNPAAGLFLPAHIAFITANRWADDRVLSVAFLGGSAKQRSLVQDVADEWTQYCSIRFKWDAPAGSSDIRIAFLAGQGSWSFIGTQALSIRKDQPTMNFGWLDVATVLHEFGHLLGCIHEHQSPEASIPWDKAVVYRFYAGPPNNWGKGTVDANVFGKYARDITNTTVYDPSSIMHYPIAPELLTDPQAAVPFNGSLSSLDREFVATMYPPSTVPGIIVNEMLPPGRYRLSRTGPSSLN